MSQRLHPALRESNISHLPARLQLRARAALRGPGSLNALNNLPVADQAIPTSQRQLFLPVLYAAFDTQPLDALRQDTDWTKAPTVSVYKILYTVINV
ncbi:hypothetical protein HMN09_01174500 [Mycena chlorophos]|uniref:Uncharacterized protein n=1 Tax=Mycena chlorophos TaxID=658473 RepID=A0A8H6S6N3_MYCCL|nr:hypothetical protein HMN09_01174500 [Mycena chlorophos]